MDFLAVPRLAGQRVVLDPSAAGDAAMRDVAVFSIFASEWPTVRLGLTERLCR